MPQTSTNRSQPPATSKSAARKSKAKSARLAAEQAEHRRRIVGGVAWVALIAVVLAGLFVLYRSTNDESPTADGAGQYPFQVGDPGPGERAIDFTLPSTKGGEVSLGSLRGKTVLLYFHEGIGCQPCWDQIRDVEKDMAKVKAAGIDEFYNVTSGPAELIAQKMRDDRLTSAALADSDLAVSRQYEMNKYGMMGDSRDGHSFLLIGPDGKIQQRADYGGAPKYTMYVPVDRVLADMTAGRKG